MCRQRCKIIIYVTEMKYTRRKITVYEAKINRVQATGTVCKRSAS